MYANNKNNFIRYLEASLDLSRLICDGTAQQPKAGDHWLCCVEAKMIEIICNMICKLVAKADLLLHSIESAFSRLLMLKAHFSLVSTLFLILKRIWVL